MKQKLSETVWPEDYALVAALSSDFSHIRYIQADLGDDKPIVTIAEVCYIKGLTQKENLMHAELLKSAPQLLKALQAFVDDMDGRFGEIPEDCDAYHDAQKLISKFQ